MIIVVAGKGGVGKTMISTLIVRCIYELKRNVKILAIDADPASNFANALGITSLISISEIIDKFNENPKGNFAEYLKEKISENIKHTEKFDFIEMGHGKGAGCYCSINDILRFVMEEKEKDYDFEIVDCEAGLEHLSRRVTTGADVLIIVTDLCEAGFRSAKTIKKIAINAGVKEENIFLVINKVKNENEKILNERIKNTGIPEICRIPYDENVEIYNTSGKALINLPSNSNVYVKVKEMCKFLIA